MIFLREDPIRNLIIFIQNIPEYRTEKLSNLGNSSLTNLFIFFFLGN